MELGAARLALLSCLGLALLLRGGARAPASGSHEWKKLILVQHWPTTVCEVSINDCREPPDYWTIHGLWPDKGGDCNHSWHFNLDEVKDLLGEMKMYWPDVLHASPNRSQFWKHEWEKHGTCAAQLPILNSQRKYFGTSLALYHQLDLNSKLLKLGIKPSTNYYHLADLRDALTRVYGVVPKIQCLPPEQDEKVQTLGQIELCYTKEDLRLRNCTEPGDPPPTWPRLPRAAAQGLSVCELGPVFYPPPRKAPR
ncbi:ribonuclease T2 isoform X2 [Ochotona curzoniae]|uniref:ribonuclease T2 isoform X2 n=1 Tax=Ochotona curzoniae TaxID=130825 RepID=UPI001B34897D|nr:ribonuclease T2 isoform X2 [Ochotona curzoniae]